MGYLIGVVLMLWLMSKASKKKDTVSIYIDKPMYVTCDELDELICKMDELEEMVKEMKG